MTPITAKPLSRSAIDALAQLFVSGPTWDGNLVVKSGRDELVQAGLAEKIDGGWNYLTGEGIQVAASWDWQTAVLSGDPELNRRWRDKVSHR